MNTDDSKQNNGNEEFGEDMMDEELIQEFLNEANEGLQQLEVDFLSLEKEPQNIDLLNNAFRVIHSIKGTSAFLGFKNLESVSHKAEDVLNKLRTSKLNLSADIMDALLCAVDTIKLILDEINKNKKDTAINIEDIKSRLEDITEERQKKEDEKKKIDDPWDMEDAQTPCKTVSENTSGSLQNNESEDLVAVTNAQSNSKPELQTVSAKPPTANTQVKREEIRSIRIDVEKLDSLFNLVGELVLSRNRNIQIHRQLSKRFPEEDTIKIDLSEAGNQLDHLTSELQWAVMKTRMIPISTVFNKFHRVVRDTGKKLGKEIELHITGDNTEIDKNIIEGIGDPLIHIIRNSADHGIDMPEERIKLGKKKAGRIDLSAYYEGNYVVIEIKDDGRGIDIEAVKRKAIEKGIISQTATDSMPKEALLNLIFEPGFSTAKNVSAVSGRGVGMDVVKTNIEGLRGQVVIDSDVGIGTDIKLKIPLTLAILDTIIVNVSNQRYAVPLSNVVETHKIKYGQIEKVRGSMVFRMRDELMPVATLSGIIKLPFNYDNDSEVTILVIKNGFLRMGLVVDKTSGQEEVVIKSLDCLDGIAEPHGVSGATILGDGSITFILDVDSLMKLADAANRQAEANEQKNKDTSQLDEKITNVVMVDNLGKEQYAIPASNVKEIEIVHKTDIEEMGGILVIKYRGKIIPLTTISSVTKVTAQREFEDYYMIILADKNNEVGLLVGRLLGIKDIDETSINKDDIKFDGVIGSAIYNGRITLLLNPVKIQSVALSQQSLTKSELTTRNSEPETVQRNILVVDDVKMHRKILEDVVKEAKHKAISAEDGLDALDKLNDSISLILTDLEMPNMDGYEFTKEAKKRHPEIPVIMVTSMSGEENRAKGIEGGVDKYIVKWSKDEVLEGIRKYLA